MNELLSPLILDAPPEGITIECADGRLGFVDIIIGPASLGRPPLEERDVPKSVSRLVQALIVQGHFTSPWSSWHQPNMLLVAPGKRFPLSPILPGPSNELPDLDYEATGLYWFLDHDWVNGVTLAILRDTGERSLIMGLQMYPRAQFFPELAREHALDVIRMAAAEASKPNTLDEDSPEAARFRYETRLDSIRVPAPGVCA